MKFRLFGIPVDVQLLFWVMTFFFGLPLLRGGDTFALVIWFPVVFVSILVHELGHAALIRRLGFSPSISLHSFGGTTSWNGSGRVSRSSRILVSLAGPFAGFALAGLAFGLTFVPAVALLPGAALALGLLVSVNIGWGLLNLAPVLPFDGGHVLEEALGPRRADLALKISFVAAVVIAVYFAWSERIWGALLFGMSAWQIYNGVRPGTGVMTGGGMAAGGPGLRGGDGFFSSPRRWWLRFKLRRLQAQADAMSSPKTKRSGPDLRVIRGGADDTRAPARDPGSASRAPKDPRTLN